MSSIYAKKEDGMRACEYHINGCAFSRGTKISGFGWKTDSMWMYEMMDRAKEAIAKKIGWYSIRYMSIWNILMRGWFCNCIANFDLNFLGILTKGASIKMKSWTHTIFLLA